MFINKFKEIIRLKNAEKQWDNGQVSTLSVEDRMAIAKIKANEHNDSRVTATPQKKVKDKSMDL